ncbi:PA14 domain family protein [Babesia bovis T2Bo]|uniref:PA14 domain-containing protein n=1 Tax=Babesia bovis TaxID=5865 RepID=A7ANZ7_BABBO|nr:PA14 domain family protein [Babesia bovis T2Bo]EDO08281.1 PA14 domain family protein [Babesia bovis T2Bo]|eukprot:XP_001611849.1 hypothetical protein [Babesia bovis T2Bo]
MRCRFIPLILWCAGASRRHVTNASFSLFEDPSDSSNSDTSQTGLSTDANNVRQAIPPGADDGVAPQSIATSSQPHDMSSSLISQPNAIHDPKLDRVIPIPGSDSIIGDGSTNEDDNDLMYYLTQYRSRVRRTVEGHLCASAFVEKNQIYTDCTMEVAPDGTVNREWCYLESQLNGQLERDWGFCVPPLNYENIRGAVLGKIREKADQGTELKRALLKHRSLLLGMGRRLSIYCGSGHKGFERSLTRLKEMVQSSEDSLKAMRSVSNDVVELKAEIKKDQERYNALRLKIPSEVLTQVSDGLLGTYYSGHLLEFPAYGSRIDRELNFVFSDFMPVVGLNPQRFSVLWHGYIRAPHSGNFVFSVTTNSNVRVELDGVEIINNGLVREGDSESGYRYFINPMLRGARLTSQSQQLVGGRFYRIQLEFSHSQQYHYRPSESVLKLEWSSLRLPLEVIKDYLYTKAVAPRLSISYLSHDHFIIHTAMNGVLAFMDDDTAFLNDLSNDLIGTTLLRTLRSPGYRTFVLQLNVTCAIYVGYISDVIPISTVTEDALEFIGCPGSLVHLVDGTDAPKRLHLKRGKLQRGHTYTFHVEVKNSPFFIFLSMRDFSEPLQGEGPIKVLSIPDTELYLSCSESSSIGDGFGCTAGLSGKLLDQKHAIWRPTEGPGSWLKLVFRRPVLVTGFQIKQSDDPSRWVRRISLDYDDGSEFFELLHSNDPRSNLYHLNEPRSLNQVILRIDELYTSAQSTALGINFLGQMLSEESAGLRRVLMNCHDTLSDNIDVQPLSEGHSYELVCSRRCFDVSSPLGKVEVHDISKPPCAALNIDLCRAGGDHSVCHAAITIMKKSEPGTDDVFGYVLSRLDRGVRDVPFRASILFKTGTNRFPQHNFFVDNGSLKGPVDTSYIRQIGANPRMGEVSYGWLRPNVSDVYELGIALPLPVESQKCIQTPGCQPNFWSIDLPRNGRYKIELVLGNSVSSDVTTVDDIVPNGALVPQRLCLEVNGQVVLNCVEIAGGSLYTLVKEIEVRNNLLKLTSTSSNSSCANYRTRLQFVKVTEM